MSTFLNACIGMPICGRKKYIFVLCHVKKVLPGITRVKYLSDRAASQYANLKNIENLVHHKADFVMVNPSAML